MRRERTRPAESRAVGGGRARRAAGPRPPARARAARATPCPGGGIYQALGQGRIDAAAWVGPYDDLKLGFNKVAPNYYYPGWWEGGPELDFFINNKAWEALSSENKAIVESAAALANVEMLAKYDYRNPAALKTLGGRGTKLFRFPTALRGSSFKAAGDVYSELNAGRKGVGVGERGERWLGSGGGRGES